MQPLAWMPEKAELIRREAIAILRHAGMQAEVRLVENVAITYASFGHYGQAYGRDRVAIGVARCKRDRPFDLTLRHELAHIITPSRDGDHGRIWHRNSLLLGSNGYPRKKRANERPVAHVHSWDEANELLIESRVVGSVDEARLLPGTIILCRRWTCLHAK